MSPIMAFGVRRGLPPGSGRPIARCPRAVSASRPWQSAAERVVRRHERPVRLARLLIKLLPPREGGPVTWVLGGAPQP